MKNKSIIIGRVENILELKSSKVENQHFKKSSNDKIFF